MPVKFNKNVYKRSITFDICLEDVSPTMTSLLQSISSRLNKSSPAALLIGNIMTANVANRATTLQIALSINLKEKKLIQHFYNYGASCSYDGYLKFHIVADNFDKNISSQNGLKQSHAQAMVIAQRPSTPYTTACQPIRRIS